MIRFKSIGKKVLPAASHPAARRLCRIAESWIRRLKPSAEYEGRKAQELRFFTEKDRVHELPAIAHYWSNKYLVPMMEPFGFANAIECFRGYLRRLCEGRPNERCAFLSIGAGSSEAEINMARWLLESGCSNFHLECTDINAVSLETARRAAALNGVEANVSFSVFDVNEWQSGRKYHAILALQSLHHVLELERLFDGIDRALHDDGCFMTDDMIGRNGHRRWPEALRIVEALWKELPAKYKYNQQLRRFEEEYDNWDCSTDGFEGIRAQEILPLLIRRFHFEVFIAFGNVIDIFVDRSFGHNFDPENEWDRMWIDRVHAIDTEQLEKGLIKPTHMLAVMTKTPARQTRIHKHFSPQFCLREPAAGL